MMPIDPFIVTTALAGGGLVLAGFKIRQLAGRANLYFEMHAQEQRICSHYRDRVLDREVADADAKRRRTEQARKAGIAGGAKRAAKTQAEAPARRAQTITELASTTFRTRAQVVALVKAERTRRQNSDAGAAAKQGG